MHRLAAFAAIVMTAPLALAGCASSTGSCIDFVSLPTPQARYDAADLVVVATVAQTDRTVEPDAVYSLHRAHVQQVVKGRLAADAIDVYAPADQCTTDGERAEYLDGDPLDDVGRAVLYLDHDSRTQVLQLVTPEGLDPLPEGSPLPFSTASPRESPSVSESP